MKECDTYGAQSYIGARLEQEVTTGTGSTEVNFQFPQMSFRSTW